MFSLLLVLCVVAGLGLSFFLVLLLFLTPKKCQNVLNEDKIIVLKLIESHRQALPINSAHGWTLVLSNCNLRCWKKELPFNVLGQFITVYGCSKEIACSAVILLNVIADFSTWSEWDVHLQDQTVHMELSEDTLLQGDLFMQCDQLVTTTPKLNPDVVMYRFGNLESNGTGWILLWSAKEVDWILYVVQPKNNDFEYRGQVNHGKEERCLLSAIWGYGAKKLKQNNISEILCNKVSNLSDAIASSQIKLRPFQPLIKTSAFNDPHFPTIRSALNDLPARPCVLLEREKRPLPATLQGHVLALVPSTVNKLRSPQYVTNFSLVSQSLKTHTKSTAGNNELPACDEKRRSRKRQKFRSDSITSGVPIIKSLQIENRRSSSLSAPVRRKPPELKVTEADDEGKLPERAASHSLLNILFQRRHSSDASDKRSRSSSPRRNSSPTRKDKPTIDLEKTSVSSQDELPSHLNMNACTSYEDNSDMEKDSLQVSFQLQREKADFKTLGENSISTVLKENFKASLININASEEEQKISSGGWMFKEMNKDITILKKISSFRSYVVLSYLCKGIIPSSPAIVWKTLCNPLTRFLYDDTVKKISVLQEYPDGQKLIYMYNESVTLLRREAQDFCILQTEREIGAQSILGFHSVEHDVCVPVKDVLRGTVIASGWLVEPVPGNTPVSQVSYLVQMVVSSPEVSLMEDISHVQAQCINNLSTYLSSKPPC